MAEKAALSNAVTVNGRIGHDSVDLLVGRDEMSGPPPEPISVRTLCELLGKVANAQ